MSHHVVEGDFQQAENKGLVRENARLIAQTVAGILGPPLCRSAEIANGRDQGGRESSKYFLRNLRHPGRLLYFPGVARAKKLGEVATAALGEDVFDLLVHHVFVARKIVPGAKNADWRWEARPVLHVREQECVGRARVMRVMHYEIALSYAIAKLDDFDVAVRLPADSLIVVLAENERLAVLELHHMLAPRVALGQGKPCSIIENVAVLKNLNERGALVRRGML
jgi:hypothetical protein